MGDQLDNPKVLQWQQRLMPWMIGLPTLLIGVFIILATTRMQSFENYALESRASFVDKYLPSPIGTNLDSVNKSTLDYLRLYSLVKMEEHSINLRYSQAAVSLMSGIYTKYLGFFTGMIMSIVGAVFIISKLREDSSELDATLKDKMTFRLVSSSPGIIFGVLGTALMIVTVLKKTEVSVSDMPLYLNQYTIPATDNIDSNPIAVPENQKQKVSPEQAEKDHP